MQWVPLTFWVTERIDQKLVRVFLSPGFVVKESRQMDKNKENYKNPFAISEKNIRKNKNTETYSRYPKILRYIRKLFGKLVGRTINMFCLDMVHENNQRNTWTKNIAQ